ncbi:hypothetical protein CFO_g1666 [Ceratocystis platani]|uniref:Uncharacterized protein n=1 Tax=Ceratocystis fimbriata f. sp. platani TaxID=88771 RepID=A0A0F8BTX8_CERFI|nr:hypothetical protein CFO_g1666 [Ceratocystis platani]
MNTIFTFLDHHPLETVVLRIQKHYPLESSEAFLRILERCLSPGSDSGDRAVNRLFSKGDAGITDIPTLGEVRGKVFILQDFKTRVPGRYGLPWSSSKVSVYNFKVTIKTLLLGLKWHFVKSFIKSIPDHKKLSITHTTASVGVRPIEIAAGSDSSKGMNARLGAFLKKKNESKKPFSSSDRVGIIAMDYPGKKIVEQILELNNHYRVPRPI